jgi:predicted TIM-barrel fold metal-dependent hydrolase
MHRTLTRDNFGPVFDADNHYIETTDAFFRYRDPKFKDRGLTLAEHEGELRYFVGGQLHGLIRGPGEVSRMSKPGSLCKYFAGKEPFNFAAFRSEDPAANPEWFDRDARLKVMDRQGLEAAWMFPTHGVCVEGPMQPDIEASLHILSGFNRWLHDEWGFAYKDRIFSVPFLSLSDLDLAIRELDWALERGARIISIRNGPVYTAGGPMSPADPAFDPFWARVQEAGVTTTAHIGFDDGYTPIDTAIAQVWGLKGFTPNDNCMSKESPNFDGKIVWMMQKKRLVHDFAAILISHGLFERFPRLRLAFIENGSQWVAPLLHDMQIAHGQNPGMFKRNPVDQFHENIWVAPYVEEDVGELARHMPAERILFGSDWPHPEGVAHPRDFFDCLDGFDDDDVRKIMSGNVRALTYA